MKTSRILLAAAVTFCMTACNEDAQFDKELYKKVINVLSDDNLVFSVNHDLNKQESTGYISIGCCLLYTSPSPRDRQKSRMPSSA